MNPNSSIYLDHAAATPLDPGVFAVMEPYLRDHFANPSSLYGAARTTRQALEGARQAVATVLGAKPTEIVWTSGGTESVNLAVQGVLAAHPGTSWVTTAIEHDAVWGQIKPMEDAGHDSEVVRVQSTGTVNIADLVGAIRDDTVLVSLMLANNEIGTIQPVAAVAKAIAALRAERRDRGNSLPLYLHTDACQAPGALSVTVQPLGVDLMTLNGSKIYGPKGSGILYVKQGTQLSPLIYGGGQERGRRSGTENVAAAVGFAAALQLAQAQRHDESRRLRPLRDQLWHELSASIPDIHLNGSLERRLPGNLNVAIPGLEGQALVLYLDGAGIMASTGSACSAPGQDPSHVLQAIGRTPVEAAASLRLTMGRGTTSTQLTKVAQTLPGIVARLRALGSA